MFPWSEKYKSFPIFRLEVILPLVYHYFLNNVSRGPSWLAEITKFILTYPDKISESSVIQLLPWLTTDIDSYTSLGEFWWSWRKDDLCGSFRRKDIDRKQTGVLEQRFSEGRDDWSFSFHKWITRKRILCNRKNYFIWN